MTRSAQMADRDAAYRAGNRPNSRVRDLDPNHGGSHVVLEQQEQVVARLAEVLALTSRAGRRRQPQAFGAPSQHILVRDAVRHVSGIEPTVSELGTRGQGWATDGGSLVSLKGLRPRLASRP